MIEVKNILHNFSESLKSKDWKSKFHGDSLVMYSDGKYISTDDIFLLSSQGKKVQESDLKSL